MKALGIIVNIFFPGIGTMIVGKIGQGVAQLLLYFLGVLIVFFSFGLLFFIGVPLCIGVWIWALASAASAPVQPIQVVVTHNNAP